MINFLLILIPLLPLIGFLANGLFGRQLGRAGGWLAVGCMGGSALIGVLLFLAALTGGVTLPIQLDLWTWLAAGTLELSLGFYVDQLTCLMLFFVTLVSFLVFLYSMGYMKGDPGFNRFFSYLCLFDFSMLMLVMGSSLPVLFIGWEGVGLCSYLLIGYYLDMPGAPDAGKKAFIVNRIGDFGFLVGMFMIFTATGSLMLPEVVEAARAAGTGEAGAPPLLAYGGAYVTFLTLMLFLGATGKSAQIPLFVWLPDAMAGPTPVSALIHAATMVTAGVYMVVRLSAMFALAPATLLTIALVAALTAFVAGTIAITQEDIKKVLAYSTVSQLGYMFLACGVGAYVAGIFHVVTHAFFKACLFLGAGSVIHAAHHEQNMMLMGGLRKHMPTTAKTFFIACLAIAGIPPLAGFFSKDEILWYTFASGMGPLYLLALLTAFMTAIYSFRAYFLTFEGECRLPEKAKAHLHESPSTMTIPLMVLAGGAIIMGFFNLPVPFLRLFGSEADYGVIGTFLKPVLEPAKAIMAAHSQGEHHHSLALEWLMIFVSVLVAACAIYVAYVFSLRRWPDLPGKLVAKVRPAYTFSYNKWYWDDVYNQVFAGGLNTVARLATWFDRWVIDGLLHTVGGTARLGSAALRAMQSGQVQAYALAILLGVNVVVWLILWF